MDWAEEKAELEARLADTQRRLHEVVERYALATVAARVGVWDWNLETGEFYLDHNVKGFLGYNADEIPNDIGVWATFIHPDDKEPVMKAAQDVIDGRAQRYVFEHRMRHKDGSVCWFMVRGEVLRNKQGKAVRFVGTDTDVTERRELEQRIRDLANGIQTQIGHDLHDGLGHNLSNIVLMLQQLETELQREGSKCADRARGARELARGAASITRSLARGLSPVIRTAGLARSLRELAINTRALHRVDCRVELPEESVLERYSDVAANELYCIVQEAITNAVKHGRPKRIDIEARVVGQRLLLNVTDDGKGFTGADPVSSSTGLKIMQYRARDLGGSLTISRRRDAGTLVVCSCPIPEYSAAASTI